ncbi:GNAT family N-acetyltransferase [Brachybacterium phenoliresistens]
MDVSRCTVSPLDSSTWPAYEAAVREAGGMPAGCWCMAFHPEGAAMAGRGADAELNCARRRAKVEEGTTRAALVLDGERCVGWCQYGTPDELPRIKNRVAYEKTVEKLPDWRIGCCYVTKPSRRHGVSEIALRGALDLIARAGGGVVEGYPEPADQVPAGFLFHGSLGTFERLGFTRTRQIGKHRWVVTRQVDPAPPAAGAP